MKIRQYRDEDAEVWDAFCRSAWQSTFLHTRRFLSYHQTRFCDRSLLIEDKNRLIGVFPAAEDVLEPTRIVSHPGITYGGLLHKGGLQGLRMIEALDTIAGFYAKEGYKTILYKAVPSIYHSVPSQDDLYALFRLGARRIRCDLSCTIDLSYRRALNSRRKRSLNKAKKAGVEVVNDIHLITRFWPVLAETLRKRHSAIPVHTVEEINTLAERFPDHIQCLCAMLENSIVAGVVLFNSVMTSHAQYIAASETGMRVSALDLVFDYAILQAMNHGKRWFDFGTSNEQEGRYLNDSLYRFKSEFGGGGVVHEFYEWELGGIGCH